MVQRPRSHKRSSRTSISFLNLSPARMTARDFDHEPLLEAVQPSTSSSSRRLIPFLLLVLFLFCLSLLSIPLVIHRLQPFRSRTDRIATGYAIVAACSSRHESLRKAATSWLSVQDVRQIVVVDWNSDPPLYPTLAAVVANASKDAPVLTVVRVEDEPHWVLTRAYNLAVRHAEYDYVFKVDCDYVVAPDAVRTHPLKDAQGTFFTGYYMNARTADEMHLNGAMVVSQRQFWGVGGYDERIQTYGFDDEDLYRRLISSGMERLNVSYNAVSHLKHDDETRGQRHVKFPRAQIGMNQLLLEKIGTPWSKEQRVSEYEQVLSKKGSVKAVYVPPAVEDLVDDDVRKEMWRLALGRRLHDDYNLPWGVIASLEEEMAERLLGNLNRRKVEAAVDEVVDEGVPIRFLLVHVQNGLGNRLRVLASGLSFAARTRREPIIIWEKDVHFGGLYRDIFNESETQFAVINTFQAKWPLKDREQYDSAWGLIEYYNYVLKDEVGKEVIDDELKNIYFKSFAIMNSQVTSWESENDQLRRLKVNRKVTDIAAQMTNAGVENVCGVHIRNRSLDEDIIGVENNRGLYAEEDALLIDKWRSTTKYTSFVSEMRSVLENGTVDKFFVATDTFELLPKIKAMFPEGKVLYIERQCDDRSGPCEQYAMADLLILSKTKMLLGSTWSSFTEAAMRLGGPKALMAGTDFGAPPSQEQTEKLQGRR